MPQKPPCALFLLDWKPVYWSTREQYYWQLCRSLRERGITPVMVVSEEVEERVRRRFEEAGARLAGCSYHARPLVYWRLIRGAAREWDVRFAHVRFFDYFTAVFWMCRWAGIRDIVFTEANSGEKKSRGWRETVVKLRAAVMCYPLVKLIAISEFIRARLLAVGIAADKVEVVYNGVDLTRFHPDAASRLEARARLGAPEGCMVLLFMAVLLDWKRPELALQVCARLRGRGRDARLWMLGQGPLRESMERLARELGIAEQVSWLGHQPDPQRWMAGADIFLHTAVGEAFGNVLVEAMGTGLPVVATRSGAAPELIRDGLDGVLVGLGEDEVRRLAEAVERVGERREEMARRARESAARFSTEQCVEQTMRVYEPWLREPACA
jgi:glycosyltransferase involved in cell wall biosynthesis